MLRQQLGELLACDGLDLCLEAGPFLPSVGICPGVECPIQSVQKLHVGRLARFFHMALCFETVANTVLQDQRFRRFLLEELLRQQLISEIRSRPGLMGIVVDSFTWNMHESLAGYDWATPTNRFCSGLTKQENVRLRKRLWCGIRLWRNAVGGTKPRHR